MNNSNLKNPVLGLCFIAWIASVPAHSASEENKTLQTINRELDATIKGIQSNNNEKDLHTDIRTTLKALNDIYKPADDASEQYLDEDHLKKARDLFCKYKTGFFRKNGGKNCTYRELAYLGQRLCKGYESFEKSDCNTKIKKFGNFNNYEVEKNLNKDIEGDINFYTTKDLSEEDKLSKKNNMKDLRKYITKNAKNSVDINTMQLADLKKRAAAAFREKFVKKINRKLFTTFEEEINRLVKLKEESNKQNNVS